MRRRHERDPTEIKTNHQGNIVFSVRRSPRGEGEILFSFLKEVPYGNRQFD
jgi:hypothetical protein